MAFVAFVTLLLLAQYTYFIAVVGMARGELNVPAPATSGNDTFERILRVQVNTMEQLMIVLPAMWICANYFSTGFAGTMGLVFLAARFIYSKAYIAEPTSRGTGMIIGFAATIALMLTGLWGVL